MVEESWEPAAEITETSSHTEQRHPESCQGLGTRLGHSTEEGTLGLGGADAGGRRLVTRQVAASGAMGEVSHG